MEISTVSEGGLLIARKIAAAYAGYPGVSAFIVGGSVSRGCADSSSDLEIGVFWEKSVPTEPRKAIVARLDGELWTMDRDGRTMEHFGLYDVSAANGRAYSGTCMVSMNHMTVADMENALTAVVEQWETVSVYQELIFAVTCAIPLYGQEKVSQWQAKAAIFPEELAAKTVQENLSFGPWFNPHSYISRNDPLVLYRHFLTIEEYLMRILLGLNRHYLPSQEGKWLDRTIEAMPLVPVRLGERLRAVFQSPDLDAAWRGLRALMFETLDLIDAHLPLVNTKSFVPGRPERNTDWARQYWNPLPPYTLMARAGQGEHDAGAL